MALLAGAAGLMLAQFAYGAAQLRKSPQVRESRATSTERVFPGEWVMAMSSKPPGQ